MSDTKFTPGPWHYSGGVIDELGNPCVTDHLNLAVAIALDDGKGATEVDANAQLIAAAPDLLEALKWIAHHYANQDMNHRDFRVEAAQRAEAAIAKAEGKL